ncbi:ELM1/GtrOC1 family putative glycosyltransferase [Mangrovicella endophytica]|uniref:ELM1/GtrOC1 family putative glycosyltransferase n=1 Tax=Mangrovicella endophytica TaxID=2066697 RepID=UPI0012FFEE13|nr:ELM1/GtrOC1 family putative glycosyltransferase [Mangrovicella endophytica]
MRVWTVSEEKAGTLTQCLGVAAHLTDAPVVLKIGRLPRWRRGLFSPYRATKRPEPDVIISCGWFAERHVARIKERFGGRPLTVHLQPPQPQSRAVYDLAFVSRHDWQQPRLDGTQYHEMIGVPHRVTRAGLQDRRPAARARLLPEDVGQPVVAMLLGGPNGAYDYDQGTIADLRRSAETLADSGWKVFVSTSRRSRPELLATLLQIENPNLHVWDRTGDNPYLDYLAAADAFIIGKDTVTMHCEALMSGKPVYSCDLKAIPGERLEKFEWFHHDLQETLRLTRRFTGSLNPYPYNYEAPAEMIAATIRSSLRQLRQER